MKGINYIHLVLSISYMYTLECIQVLWDIHMYFKVFNERQSLYPSEIPFSLSLYHYEQSFIQSVNQSISQSFNQSISQSVNQSISQSVNQSISQSVNQSISQ